MTDLTNLLLCSQTWARPLDRGDYAIAVLSTRTDGTPYTHAFALNQLNITKPVAYSLTDLFTHVNYGKFLTKDSISVRVNPNGIVMIRATPVQFDVPQFEFSEFEEIEVFDVVWKHLWSPLRFTEKLLHF